MFRKSDVTAATDGPLSDPVLCGVASGLADMFRPVPHPWEKAADGEPDADGIEGGEEPAPVPGFGP